MVGDSLPNAATCPQCHSQLEVFVRSDQGRCPLCRHTFALPPMLEAARGAQLPRLVPLNNSFLECEFIWNAGFVGGLCLILFGVAWWAISRQLGFRNDYVVIPMALGLVAIIRSLWRGTKTQGRK
jgi:hypothetical protein